MACLEVYQMLSVFHIPRDPITETENGFMEPKYYAFCFGDWTPYSLSENMTGFLGYIMFNVCESLLIEVSSRIHGSGIFTYIN